MDAVLRALTSGGLAVYPTETLYALGCDGRCVEACARVAAVKGRPEEKPLPLLVGSLEQLSLVTLEMHDMLLRLGGRFWPGPLSILVRATKGLAPQVMDRDGFTSVRVSSHPVAARMCRLVDAPLVATSANASGRPPAETPDQLESRILEAVDGVYLEAPFPGGGAPSTVVRFLGGNMLRVHRVGAVSVDELECAGFRCEAAG